MFFSEALNRYDLGSTKDMVEQMQEHLWIHKEFTSKVEDWVVKYL